MNFGEQSSRRSLYVSLFLEGRVILISSLSAKSVRNTFQANFKNSRGDSEWRPLGAGIWRLGWSRASAGGLRTLSPSPSLGSVTCHWLFSLAGGFSSCSGKGGLIYNLLA